MKSYKGWALLSVAIQATTIIVLKLAANDCGELFCWSFVHYYAAAVSLLFFRVLSWNFALSKGNLSDVYVFTALTPVLLLWLSIAFLNEEIGIASIAGASVIAMAIYMQQRNKQKI
jgi:uncharacterized membrane protein